MPPAVSDTPVGGLYSCEITMEIMLATLIAVTIGAVVMWYIDQWRGF